MPVTLLPDTWQRIEASHTVLDANPWNVDLYVEQRGASAGDCFLGDDISLMLAP